MGRLNGEELLNKIKMQLNRPSRARVSNDEVLRQLEGEHHQAVVSAKATAVDKNILLADILWPLMQGVGAAYTGAPTGLNSEATELVASGRRLGVDYVLIASEEIRRHKGDGATAKQICSQFMQQYKIPSQYKLPLQNIFKTCMHGGAESTTELVDEPTDNDPLARLRSFLQLEKDANADEPVEMDFFTSLRYEMGKATRHDRLAGREMAMAIATLSYLSLTSPVTLFAYCAALNLYDEWIKHNKYMDERASKSLLDKIIVTLSQRELEKCRFEWRSLNNCRVLIVSIDEVEFSYKAVKRCMSAAVLEMAQSNSQKINWHKKNLNFYARDIYASARVLLEKYERHGWQCYRQAEKQLLRYYENHWIGFGRYGLEPRGYELAQNTWQKTIPWEAVVPTETVAARTMVTPPDISTAANTVTKEVASATGTAESTVTAGASLTVEATDVTDAAMQSYAVREALELKPVATEKPLESPVMRKIHGIQFDKNLFKSISNQLRERFCKTFRQRLAKLEDVFAGDRRQAGNDYKLVRGLNGSHVLKRRVGDARLSMIVRDGVLTLLAISHHDRQMLDIRKVRARSVGYVYYDMDDFLAKLDNWERVSRQNRELTFADYLAVPANFVYDEDQAAIITSGELAENISIIGSAGAGKSVIGFKWLSDELFLRNHSCLYLTMSENLVYTLAFELNKGADTHGRLTIKTTFDIMREALKAINPHIPERSILNAEQSYAVFARFWADEIDWTQFWERSAPDFAYQSEETTRIAVWRELHGIVKGSVPETTDYRNLRAMADYSTAERYNELLRQEKKSSTRGHLWTDMLFRCYERYQRYLERFGLYDDNDVASLLVRSRRSLKKKYDALFLDECQDLTERELLALFVLLGRTPVKRMASDRCQMVQPTYFSENWMRTAANTYAEVLGHRLESGGIKPKFLHYNYRSTRYVIDFQNYMLQYFHDYDILTLKQTELQEIVVPPLTVAGVKPIWIEPSAKNRELLTGSLCTRLDASDLQIVLALGGSQGPELGAIGSEAITDVLRCKGMEYRAVLLYNILTEMRFDAAMAWKYFYVGATRANRVLIIYEKSAVPGAKSYEFLELAAELGLVDRVPDILEKSSYTNETWLGYIYSSLRVASDEKRIETAENALNFGQYELALSIYRQEGEDENMIRYCEGKVQELRGEFTAAIRSYANIVPEWNNRGRTRANSVGGLLKSPDIAGAVYLAAYFLSLTPGENMLTAAKAAYSYKYGSEDDFYRDLYAAMEEFDFASDCFHLLAQDLIASVARADSSLDRLLGASLGGTKYAI